jgi:hypothetical protein
LNQHFLFATIAAVFAVLLTVSAHAVPPLIGGGYAPLDSILRAQNGQFMAS